MDENPRIADLKKKLEKDPASRLFAQLAEELRKEGRLDEAIEVAQAGLAKNPNYPSARLTLARALLDSGHPEVARPELEQVVKTSPDNILASRLLGEALEGLGEAEQAIRQFERTLQLSPGDVALEKRTGELRRKLAPPKAPEPKPAPVVQIRPSPPPLSPRPAAPIPAKVVVARPPVSPAVRAAAPKAEVVSVSAALDRDLASGTFTPGMLNSAGLLAEFAALEASAPEPRRPIPATTPAPAVKSPPIAQLKPAPRPAPAAPAVEASHRDEVVHEETDLASQTLPLTSLTLADIYLQQGLKAEASAVLSQVIREEPDNAQARSRFATVSSELAGDQPPENAEQFADDDIPTTIPWSSPVLLPFDTDQTAELHATSEGVPPIAETVDDDALAHHPRQDEDPISTDRFAEEFVPPPAASSGPAPKEAAFATAEAPRKPLPLLRKAPSSAEPKSAGPAPPVVKVAPSAIPAVKTKSSDRSINALRAFLGAAERESLQQRATERGAF